MLVCSSHYEGIARCGKMPNKSLQTIRNTQVGPYRNAKRTESDRQTAHFAKQNGTF